MGDELSIPMDDYDWREAFGCAGDPEGQHNSADVRPAVPASSVSLAAFGRADVERVFAMREGANDEANWLCYGQLKDGRYFYLSAGCDYTGWDCQSGGCAFVSNDQNELLQFGMTADERAELGLPNPPTEATRFALQNGGFAPATEVRRLVRTIDEALAIANQTVGGK